MRLLRALFSDSGTISSMRVMAMTCCITAIGIAVVVVCKDKPDYAGASILCGVFLGAAFGGKIAQKNIETKAR